MKAFMSRPLARLGELLLKPTLKELEMKMNELASAIASLSATSDKIAAEVTALIAAHDALAAQLTDANLDLPVEVTNALAGLATRMSNLDALIKDPEPAVVPPVADAVVVEPIKAADAVVDGPVFTTGPN